MRRGWGLAVLIVAACGAPEEGDDPVDSDDVEVPATTAERVPTRRLTASEIDRVVRDLLGTELRPGESFPADDASHGFDVVAEGLVVSPLHVELVETTAAQLAAEATDRPLEEPILLDFEGEDDVFDVSSAYTGLTADGVGLYSSGSAAVDLDLPEDGTYRVSVWAWQSAAGEEPAAAELSVGFQTVDTFDVPSTSSSTPTEHVVEVDLRAGASRLEVYFTNDFVGGDGSDRNLFVDAVRVEGPLGWQRPTDTVWDRVMVCDPDAADDPRACARRILEPLGARAWRRPLDDHELEGLLGVFDEVVDAGDPAAWGVEFALRALLASPHFLFLVEPEAPAEGREPVDAHTLAQRLSFALWGTLPDEALRAHADAGDLTDPKVLEAEARRMLADPKAWALVEDFAGQWLMIRALDDAAPDFWSYPSFTDGLRDSMRLSMELSFWDLLQSDRPAVELVTGTTMVVDEPLARHLGLLPLGIDEPEVVDVSTLDRPGWLGQPGLLTATSYPTRTSPVRRGVWVLSSLLCAEPEPPPPGVEGFPEPDADAATVRERLEAHRANPACAGCHDDIDPIGLAFERFDGVGRGRDYDAGEPIDATGELPSGEVVDGLGELADVLGDDPRLTSCVAEKAFTWTFRRAPTDDDDDVLEQLHGRWRDDSGSLADLFVALVTSEAFRTHGSDE